MIYIRIDLCNHKNSQNGPGVVFYMEIVIIRGNDEV